MVIDNYFQGISLASMKNSRVAQILWEIPGLEDLWTDPLDYPDCRLSSIGNSQLDTWLSQLTDESKEMFMKIKLLRNHMLLTLVVLDDLSYRLSQWIGSEILPDEMLRSMNEFGFSIPESWWSLVGFDEDIDEYGLREGAIVDEYGILFRTESWRVADAVSGVSTQGAIPYDNAQWLMDLSHHAFVESRNGAMCPWFDAGVLLKSPIDGISVEIMLHKDILQMTRNRATTAQSCFTHMGQLLGSIPMVFENYGRRVHSRGFSRVQVDPTLPR